MKISNKFVPYKYIVARIHNEPRSSLTKIFTPQVRFPYPIWILMMDSIHPTPLSHVAERYPTLPIMGETCNVVY